MSARKPIPFLLPLLCLLITHCGSLDKKPKPIEGTEKDKDGPGYLVGIIEYVNPQQKFVLFKAVRGMPLPPGHSLTALDSTGALSELTVTPERKQDHVTADIKSGNPRAGNLVIYRPESAANAATPLTISQTAAPTSAPTSPAVEWREGQPPPMEDTFAPMPVATDPATSSALNLPVPPPPAAATSAAPNTGFDPLATPLPSAVIGIDPLPVPVATDNPATPNQ